MGQCVSCSCKRRVKEDHEIEPSGTPPAPGRANKELTRFFSFEVDSCGNLVPERKESQQRLELLTESTATAETPLPAFSVRDRIPSHVNVDAFDAEHWWSEANLTRSVIANDLGQTPTVISRPVKVTVIPSSFFASHRDIEVFPELGLSMEAASPSTTASLSSRRGVKRLLVFKLKMAERVMVSLNEVVDQEVFDTVFNPANRENLLQNKLKLILSPINSPLPIPAKKPRDAETIGSYFGMENVDFYIDEEGGGTVRVVSILINIYAKWIIRKFMPLMTQSTGRICDFILLSSDDKIVFANFRLLATQVSQALMKP